ncbi:MAG: FAD-binding oxidoreductase, partial [Bacteroidales bacterium]|nr:FAD-binding oxidoreductase [Bacteroidales bacterium]
MKKIFIPFLVTVIGLFSCSNPEVTEIQNGVQFKTDSCIVQVQFYKDDVVRVQKCPLNGTLEKKSLMVVIDSLEPVSFRTIKQGDKEILAVGGSDHKTGDNTTFLDENYDQLEKYTKTLYPDFKVQYKWSTQDCVTLDKVPYIGEFSKMMPQIYIATGFKKWGMTSSHVAARIITDKILGRENKYAEIFSSLRFKPLKNHKEFGNMLKQSVYSLVLNKIKVP